VTGGIARWAPGLAVIGALVATALLAVALSGRLAVDRSATFSASHVDVTVAVVAEGDDHVVVARFVPDQPGLHLYGPDLPDGGIDGAGRPTRLAVVGGGWKAATAVPHAAEPTPFATALPGFSAPFSILPDGPVTLRQPIEPAPGDASTVRVALTYMACTADGRCFPPVVGQELDVAVP
jgi:hypothetical protein